MAAGSLTACPVVVGLPAIQTIQVNQTFVIIDSVTKEPIPGVQVAIYPDQTFVTKNVTDEDGRIDLSYESFEYEKVELQITDIDGAQNNQYIAKIVEISISEELITIELIQVSN